MKNISTHWVEYPRSYPFTFSDRVWSILRGIRRTDPHGNLLWIKAYPFLVMGRLDIAYYRLTPEEIASATLDGWSERKKYGTHQ